ncbi:unnamed protein product [Effrenium voratum]|nr:unnamed protein product [Effrenium voratum]
MRRGRNVGGSVVGASLELRHKGSPIIASATPSKVHSTPSRIISIRTPLRPCSRQRSKEVQDDVRSALEEQSAELLRVALQRRHVCPRDHALHEAVRQGNCAAARLLLQNSAEPNDRCLSFERGCELPLQLALSSNLVRPSERLEMVDMLLQARADVSQRRSDPEGCPPLHDAIRRGDAAIVQLLLRYQADPNATNAFGEAPLELAVRGSPFVAVSDSASLMEALLQSGACPLVPGLMEPEHCGMVVDMRLRELLQSWSAWWRCRMLAWVRSRGSGPLCNMVPDLLLKVAQFL